jgi:hypothetical protein
MTRFAGARDEVMFSDRRRPASGARVAADIRVIIAGSPVRFAEMITRISLDLVGGPIAKHGSSIAPELGDMER